MNGKNVAVTLIAVAALGFGAFMIYRSMSGGVGDSEVESMFSQMPTEELLHRRSVLAAMLAESPATEPKSEHRLKYEEGLAELDAMLLERGVDPEQVETARVGARDD